MRKLVGTLGLVGLLTGCVPASIVANDGPRVTYAWNGDETSLDRVYSLATSYCNGWHAPPRLVGDDIEGNQHRSTFACVPPPTLPLRSLQP